MPRHVLPRIVVVAAGLLLASVAAAVPGSWEFFENAANDYDYADQVELPAGFGSGEFTFEMWVRLDDSYPVGSTASGADQRLNWSDSDNQPYSSASWWWSGNFLIDGHNNNDINSGTFSLQVYGGGRIRWHLGDGQAWAVQAWPATTTPSLLDGLWHQITLVRRWSGASSADLELWIDGALVATETSSFRTNMATMYWNSWPGFPANERGWFYAAEKQAAIGLISQWEDYKGLIDEIRFWGRAKSAAEIAANYADPVTGSESGLLGHYAFGEAMGNESCDSLAATRCIDLNNPMPNVWSGDDAPLTGGGGDTQAPTTPTNLQGNAISDTQIDLTWNASTDNIGVVAYDVRRDGVVVASPTGTSYSDTGLTASTSYDYTVTARDAAGNVSPQTSTVSVTTQSAPDTQAPSVPTNLQGNAITDTRIDLTWTASTDNVGVVEYDVLRDGTVVASPTGTSFSDTGLTPNTSYSYTVLARDAAGNESAQSTAVMVTTDALPDSTPPTTPTNLQGSATSSSSVNLTWTASTDNVGVVAYEVRRDGVVVANPTDTSYSDTGLTASTSYTYTVSARDAAGNVSAQSLAVMVTTDALPDSTPPSTPTNLQGSAISDTRIDLTWNASTDNVGVVEYDVLRDGMVVASRTGTSYSDAGLSANTSYSYTVLARDAAGNESAQSAAVSVTTNALPDSTPPSTPTNLQGSAISDTRIDLTWNASTDNVGVVEYDVLRDGIFVASRPGTSYSDNGLTPNTSYSYTVLARDAAGNESAESTAVMVTTDALPDSTPPSTPSNLQGNAISDTRIDLTWNPSTDNVGVVEYDVLRDGIFVASRPGTSYSDTGLTPNTSYSYAVLARDAEGNESAESAAVMVTTDALPDSTPPSTPTNLQGNATSDTRIDLSWTASTDNVGVVAYEVRRDGVVVANPTGTSYSDSGLAANTSYSYTVSARDAAGNISAQSLSTMVTTDALPDATPPSTPTNLAGSAASSSSVTLTWTASTDNVGVVGYTVRRNGVDVGNQTGTSFIDSGLAASTTYTYTVVALDDAGNRSAASAAVDVTTTAATRPPPVTSSGGGGGAVGVTEALLLLALFVMARRRRPAEVAESLR